MTMLDHALAFRDRGWRPFPLDHPDLPQCVGLHGPKNPCPTPDRGGDKRGKHPCVAYGTAAASEAPDQLLRHWFDKAPRNIGIACGPSGLVVIDEDELNALAKLAADLGHDLPITYRTRTARGWHWYFEAPADIVLGNRSGRLAEYCIDVRGGKGMGGFVVAAGSLHVSGHVYVAEDEHVVPAPLPRWLIPEIQDTGRGDAADQGARTAWDDEPRYGSALDLKAQYARRVDEIHSHGGDFRHELFLAARDGYRLIAVDLLDRATMAEDLRLAVYRVWGAEPDERDKHIVNQEARQAAERSPWVLLSESPPLQIEGVAPGVQLEVEALSIAERAAAKADELAIESERRRQMAKRVVAAEGREPLRVLSGLAFLRASTPRYLVPKMLFADSTAKMYGPPGGTKSYFALDLVMHMVMGRPWRGRLLGRQKVHYVMAEGQAVNTVRALGWLHHHMPNVDPSSISDWLTVIPQGVLLTPEGVARYLRQVETDQPALIVLDTKNAMMDGNENDASDVAVMVRSMRAIKDAAGGACVLLIDHTGLSDATRGRGSNAVTAAMDTEIRVSLENGTGTAEVTRNKAAIPGASWSYRLHTVADVPDLDADVDAPAVIVAAERGDESDTFARRGLWWQDDRPVPAAVEALPKDEPGVLARQIFRVLRYVGDDLTSAAIRSAIDEHPGREGKCSQTSANRGRKMLEKAGVVLADGQRYGLAPAYLD